MVCAQGIVKGNEAGADVCAASNAAGEGVAEGGEAQPNVAGEGPRHLPMQEQPQSPSPTASKENEGTTACGNSATDGLSAAALAHAQYGCSGVAALLVATAGAGAEPASSSVSGAKEATLSPSHFLLKECC